MRRPTRRATRRFVVAASALAALAGTFRAGADETPGVDQDEVFTSPIRGEAWRAMRDPASGRKWFEAADGRRAATLDEICLAEEAALTPLQKTVEAHLLADASQIARAAEPADVTIVFARQPADDAGVAARAKYAPLFAEPLARSRAILARLATRRADPDHVDPVEDQTLLTSEEKTDLAAARDLVRDLGERMRREVRERASADAALDQSAVRAFLEGRGDVRVFGSSWILSAICVRVPLSMVTDLATRFPEIARVERVGRCGPCLSVSVPTIQGGTWWSAGFNGAGATIADLDTGCDATHPALSVSSSHVSLSYASTQSDYADDASTVDDFFGHGTHTAGIFASTDSTERGVAYGCTLMAVKTGYANTAGYAGFYDPDVWSGADWAVNHGAQVFNCSFGSTGVSTNGSLAGTKFMDACVFDLGIDVAISAGNSGSSSGTIASPSDGFNVICVGNFSDAATTSWSDDSIASSSSRGPCSDGRRKPDIAAPGTAIMSCNAFWEGSNPDFIAMTGTSMAAPHVAGSMGILRGAGASWAPEAMKALLVTTARNTSPVPTSPGNTWGYGALDLGNAYACRGSVAEGTIGSSGGRQLVSIGALAAGKRASLVWNRHVHSNGANSPSSYSSPTDLDLYLYDGTTGSLVASSTSSLNTIEQVQATSAISKPVLKVVSGTFPSGVTSEPFATAAETSSTPATSVSPLSCAFTTVPPSFCYANTDYSIVVSVTNVAGFSATSPVLTLTAPTGFTITNGGTRTLSTLTSGASTNVSYTVRATSGPPGSKTFLASVSTSAFGETVATDSIVATTTLDDVAPTGTISIAGGAAYSASSAVTLGLSASDPSGVASMRFRDAGGAWTTPENYAASKNWTLPAQGACTVQVEYRDVVGNASQYSASITFDSVAPSGSVSLGVGQFTNAANANLVVSASDATSGVADQRIGDGASVGAWEPYGTAHVVSLGATGTATTRTAQFRDAAGNTSPTYSATTTRDVVAPTGSIVIDGGAQYTNDSRAVLALAASDDLSGVADMRLSLDGGASWTPWSGMSPSVGVTLQVADATNTVKVQYRDNAGNASPVYAASIFVDATGPTGTLVIDGGAKFTASSNVRLTISATDASSGVAAMRLRDEGGSWGAWTSYGTSVQWTLPAGEGAKTIVAQFRDGSGNLSNEVPATIVRDLSPPSGTVAVVGAPALNHSAVSLALTSFDAASGVTQMRLRNDGGAWGAWTDVSDAADFALTAGEGPRRVWAQFRDAVGNESTPAAGDVLVDLTPPTGSLALNGGSGFLLPWDDLSAVPTADDGASGSGVATVEYSQDGGKTWTDPSDPTVAATLPAPALVEGSFEVLARWRDVAGNVSAPAKATAYRVAAPTQALDAAKTLTGAIAAGGDVDAYTVELLEGDALTISQSVRPAKKGADFGIALDVYDPTHALLAGGRFPADAKKPGIAKLVAPTSGTYVVVVRAVGADAAAGGTYSLAESVKSAKRPRVLAGLAKLVPGGGDLPLAVVSFDAADGAILTGSAKLLVNTPVDLVGPDGSTTSFVLRPVRGVAKLGRIPLTGGTGTYQLRFHDVATYSLSLLPAPRIGRATETPGDGEK